MGDMWVVAAVSLFFVQDLEEHLQHGVASRSVVGLAVDVEEDCVGGGGHDLLQIREEHGVCELVREKLDCVSSLPFVGVLFVLEKVGKHLDEVGLAAAEEAGDPDPVFVRHVYVGFDGGEQHRNQVVEVCGQFPGDDELIELLPHREVVELIGLDHAVNRAMDVAFEKVLDLHDSFSLGTRVKAR